MKNIDMVKKNYDKDLWTDEMLDVLETKGKITKTENRGLKSDKIKKMNKKAK